jgi:hypothetical protein
MEGGSVSETCDFDGENMERQRKIEREKFDDALEKAWEKYYIQQYEYRFGVGHIPSQIPSDRPQMFDEAFRACWELLRGDKQ